MTGQLHLFNDSRRDSPRKRATAQETPPPTPSRLERCHHCGATKADVMFGSCTDCFNQWQAAA